MTSAWSTAGRAIRRVVHRLGFDVTRAGTQKFGIDADRDLVTLLGAMPAPVIFDVGANVGQSVDRFRDFWDTCTIHSFEPSPLTFEKLEANTSGLGGVHVVNAGVGAVPGTMMLQHNERPVMSSFLPLGKAGWGSVVEETEVDIVTVDAYAAANGIERIDVLKTDTQGFDLEVLRCASSMFERQRVHVVLTEVNFNELYVGQAPFDEIFRYLVDRGFRPAALYNLSFSQSHTLNWCDAMFVCPAFG